MITRVIQILGQLEQELLRAQCRLADEYAMTKTDSDRLVMLDAMGAVGHAREGIQMMLMEARDVA